jgi:SAM-dependent methyltransferase
MGTGRPRADHGSRESQAWPSRTRRRKRTRRTWHRHRVGRRTVGPRHAVGPREQLLEIAAERAHRDGLTNIDTQVADAHDLPFADESFDRVTSRLAAMYFADCRRAFQEALRVLRRGGRATYLVWGSFEQPMFKDIVGVLFEYVAPPEDEPGAPSPFRFSEPGTLARAMAEAGFEHVREESVRVPTTFPGGPALVGVVHRHGPVVATRSAARATMRLKSGHTGVGEPAEQRAGVARFHVASWMGVP